MKPNHHLKAGKFQILLAAFCALVLQGGISHAQVVVTGDVDPGGATSPTWNVGGQLTVGDTAPGTLEISVTGDGTLEISGDGVVSNTNATIGSERDSTGLVTVTDNGTWTNSGILSVGGDFADFADGTLEISGNGVVSASSVRVANTPGSTGTLNLLGGTLSTSQLSEGRGSGTVNFDGGTLRLTADQPNLFGGFEAGDVTLSAGGGTIDTQNFSVATSLALSGVGGLTKQGSGTFTLTGANTYTGGTTITAGELQIGDGGTTGSILGDVVNNGFLNFNRSNDISFGGDITGTGGLGKLGGGDSNTPARIPVAPELSSTRAPSRSRGRSIIPAAILWSPTERERTAPSRSAVAGP